MVDLKEISEDNFLQAFNLELAPGQEAFVSHPIRSLAQAYVYRQQCQPFGIYDGDTMVGYVMVIYDYDIDEYNIWHMMIDRSKQCNGYGSSAMDRVLEYIGTKPFGASSKVTLTCNKDNVHAKNLYEHKGFIPTGVADDDEIEMSLILGSQESSKSTEIMIENMIAWATNKIGNKEYIGWCLSFIEDALEISNDIEIFGGDCAKESYEMYQDSAKTGVPEKGSFVFYDCLCSSEQGLINWGHCGISLGNRQVIHAWDVVRIDDYLEIEEMVSNAGAHPTYLGWVPIERVLAQKED